MPVATARLPSRRAPRGWGKRQTDTGGGPAPPPRPLGLPLVIQAPLSPAGSPSLSGGGPGGESAAGGGEVGSATGPGGAGQGPGWDMAGGWGGLGVNTAPCQPLHMTHHTFSEPPTPQSSRLLGCPASTVLPKRVDSSLSRPLCPPRPSSVKWGQGTPGPRGGRGDPWPRVEGPLGTQRIPEPSALSPHGRPVVSAPRSHFTDGETEARGGSSGG